MADKAETFEEYMRQNPRLCIPNKKMEEFLEFAKTRYKDYGVVNGDHGGEDDEEELEQTVEYYIHDAMEALLLFQEFALKQEGVKE
jgi:hypothetical protein